MKQWKERGQRWKGGKKQLGRKGGGGKTVVRIKGIFVYTRVVLMLKLGI